MIHVIVVANELVDQFGTLGAWVTFVGEKLFDGLHAGGKAGEIEIDAAKEIRIAAQAGRLDLHALPFGSGEFVDLAPSFGLFPDKSGTIPHGRDRGGGVRSFEPGQDSGLSAALDGDQAGVICFGNIGIATFNKGFSGDIALFPVGVGGNDAHLLFAIRVLNDRVFWGDGNGSHAAGFEVEFGPGGDPFMQNLVIFGSLGRDLSAFMRYGANGFEDH